MTVTNKTGISTHILDLASGRPAQHVPVTLEYLDNEWTELSTHHTDLDGRAQLLTPAPVPGLYRIRFDISHYHVSPLYPEITVTFEVRSLDRHFHIPLLLSPNGYTTYRGS